MGYKQTENSCAAHSTVAAALLLDPKLSATNVKDDKWQDLVKYVYNTIKYQAGDAAAAKSGLTTDKTDIKDFIEARVKENQSSPFRMAELADALGMEAKVCIPAWAKLAATKITKLQQGLDAMTCLAEKHKSAIVESEGLDEVSGGGDKAVFASIVVDLPNNNGFHNVTVYKDTDELVYDSNKDGFLKSMKFNIDVSKQFHSAATSGTVNKLTYVGMSTVYKLKNNGEPFKELLKKSGVTL